VKFDLLSRLDEPRFRSWVQAGLALLVPAVMYGLIMLPDRQSNHGMMVVVLLMVGLIAGCAFSGLALLSSLNGLLALDSPRPAWRYIEPLLVGLPFLVLVLLILAGGAAQLYF
jgi:hypothetical protein